MEKTLVISDVKSHHGPEVQAFLPGQTGLNYKHGDVEDLAHKISILLADPEKSRQFANVGAARVRELMGPELMLEAFIDAIRYVTDSRT